MTFPVGDGNGATETAVIYAVDDSIVEDDEEFMVSIISTDPPCVPSTATSQTVTIVASDRKSVLRLKYEVINLCTVNLQPSLCSLMLSW